MIFSKGEPLKKVPTEQLVDELFAEIDKYYAAGKQVVATRRPPPRPRAWLAENEDATALTPERLAALEAEAARQEAEAAAPAIDDEASPRRRPPVPAGLAGRRRARAQGARGVRLPRPRYRRRRRSARRPCPS